MGFNTIETPGIPGGDENQKIDGLYRYLVRMADELNIQLGKIGSNDLTDEERQVMMDVIRETSGPAGQEAEYLDGLAQMESLKSLIVKTAKFVQTKLQEYRTSLLRETVAEGQFGRYVRNTGLDVIVNPEGVTQNFTFREIVQGLRNFEIFSKNYIKTGLLRTEGALPVYGLQIGKDIVTFSEDGEETYHDGNKAIEVLADAINFFSSQNRVMQIKNGLIDCSGDMKIRAGGTFEVDSTNFKLDSVNKEMLVGDIHYMTSGIWRQTSFNGAKVFYTASGDINLSERSPDTDASAAGVNLGQITNQNDAALALYLKKKSGTNTYNKYLFLRYYVDSDTGVPDYTKPAYLIGSGNSVTIGAANSRFGLAYIYQLGSNELSAGRSKVAEGYFINIYVDTLRYVSLVQSSSRDIKHDIEPMEAMGEKLDALRPVTFVYDDDENEQKRFGLIYEDAVEVLPEICTGDESNKAINYVEMIPMLLKEIQELRARVKALEERGGE